MGEKFDIFDAFQPYCQNLTRQIIKSIQRLVKDSDHKFKIFSVKYLKSQYPSKFPVIRYLNPLLPHGSQNKGLHLYKVVFTVYAPLFLL